MSTLIMMCGLAFSGKSTLARRIVSALGCDYISLDDINDERGLWGGHGIPVEEWEQTHQIALARVRDRLDDGRCVVLDDTNSLRWLRDRFRDAAREGGHDTVLAYVTAPIEAIRERMVHAERTGERRGLTDDVLEDHVGSFEEPTSDESPITYRSGESVDELLTALDTRLGRAR